VVLQHTSDLHILLGPTSLEVAQGIRPEALFSIVDGLRRMYDFIVIDVGSTLSENAVTLMDAAEHVLLVAVPELAALHDVSRFIHFSRSLAYPAGKILTVLNRAGMPGGVKLGDIEKVFHHELFAEIPDDEARVTRSLNRGIPLFLTYRRNPVSQAIQQLAKTLVQLSLGELAQVGGSLVPAKAKPGVRLAQSGTD
jgi:pilus assembly protein CpaE